MYKVVKKDGSTQDFSWQKLIEGIMNSGATKEEAEKVAEVIELWLSTVAEDGIIQSNVLHIKVLQTLKEINVTAAAKFEEFKKPEPQ